MLKPTASPKTPSARRCTRSISSAPSPRLRDKGEGEETIAAAFGVTAAVVKQRLKLAHASPVLLAAYEKDELTLEQLMAFCLVDDHKRQEQVFAALDAQWNKNPQTIRRMLTETAVAADDCRALFVGTDAYEAADGTSFVSYRFAT